MSLFAMYLLALLCVVGFLALGILSIVKGRLVLGLLALASLALAIFLGVYATRTGVQRITSMAKRMNQERSGEDNYTDLFGQPARPCVSVLHHRNRPLSFENDEPTCLRMQLCAEELARILQRDVYTGERVASTDAARPIDRIWATGNYAPETLGDTVLVYQLEDEPLNNWRWIYCNLDSTEAIVVELVK